MNKNTIANFIFSLCKGNLLLQTLKIVIPEAAVHHASNNRAYPDWRQLS